MDLLTSAFRQLRAHAAFSLLVVLLLALSIGANTAIFGVVYAVLLKPLPYPEPGDLVMVRKIPRDPAAQIPGNGDMMPDNEFLGWTEAVPKSFRALAGYRNSAATLSRGDGAIRVPAATVTGGFFPLLGVSAWRGRLFDENDLKPGAPPTTVLSHAAWQAQYNGDEGVLGQVVKLDDVAHTIIGVLPPSFEFIDPVQFWRPLAIAPNAPGQLRIQMIRVFGRLLPGTSLDVAQRELDGLSQTFWNNLVASVRGPGPQAAAPTGGGVPPPRSEPRLDPAASARPNPTSGATAPIASSQILRTPSIATTSGGPPAQAPGPRGPGGPSFRPPFADATVALVTLQEQLAQQSRTTLWLLLGAVAFVLLIACANIANLQLARAAGRKRDSAVRAALGASPVRLALELLAENVLLALLGGSLGVLLAWAGTRGLSVWLADYLPRVNPVGLDSTVLVFALLVATLAGLGFGLAPAVAGSRVDLLETLKEGNHQSSPAGQRWRQGLVALEVALALVLAVNTGLLAKSIYQLYATELGFRTRDVLTANLALPRRYGTPTQQHDFATRWLESLAALPGVKTAALTDAPPLSPYQQVVFTSAQGSAANANASAGSAPRSMAVVSVTPDFFRATGIALRQGRLFTAQDGAEAPLVALVNEAFVKQYYPQGLTLGAQINGPGAAGHGGPPPTASIVGVVADVRPRGFESSAQPLAYYPLEQQPRTRLSAVLQFEGDAALLSRAVTAATHKLDADLALDQPSTLEQQISRQTAPRRVTLLLTGAFALTAVVLAALGILGVMSYTVTQRTQEIGVRMALGADAGMILRWMLRYGGGAVGTGLLAGLGLTVATNKVLTTLLAGVTALDPWIIMTGVTVLAVIGLAACLIPARRATRINPVEALRSE
jgi:predicted permease